MSHDSRFKRIVGEHNGRLADVHSAEEQNANTVFLQFNGQTIQAQTGDSVAAAVMLASAKPTRNTANKLNPRAPYCMMGVCFECLMCVDGVQNKQACMVSVEEGMVVETQAGVRTETDYSNIQASPKYE